jgi:hypothetical protein
MDNFDATDSIPADEPGKAQPGGVEDIDPSRRALVKEWASKISSARKQLQKTAFDRMEKCQQLAIYGADKEWTQNDNYVVPVVKRHIDQAVSALYARNPRAVAQRKKRLNYSLWDGKTETAKAALDLASRGDPNAVALLQEIESVRQQNGLLDKSGQTLEVLYHYYMSEQAYGYKQQIKALVRRVKINGVGYVKLNFQRILEKRAEITAQINDVTNQIASVEGLLRQAASETWVEPDSARMEELRLLMRDLQAQEEIIVREGPVFDFPRSNEIIFDPACRHLKSWAGARWVAHEFDMTPEEISEVYKIDVSKHFTKYSSNPQSRYQAEKGEQKREKAKVWEVQDKKNMQFFTICDGYPDFLVEPSAPTVQIERFFTVFPLVFNEVESEEEIIPPSDVWLSRHMQSEYNRSRQGLREHRIASRPYYVTERGKLEETDKDKLANHPANAIIELNALLPGQKVDDVLQRGAIVPIDPNQYEVNMIYQDMLRVVGSQEANLGSTAGSTATESSIAESSRMSSMGDNVDDLDDMLSELARSVCQLMLLELSKETVVEIVGPGAVWPEMRPTREDIAKEITLEVKAGSSGRPNKAAELANMERAMPFLLQLPGINPEPLTKRYLDLLDIDLEDAISQGLPSVTAINAMVAKASNQPMAAGMGPGSDPSLQGGQGAQNAPSPGPQQGGPQPGYPAPANGAQLP